MRTYDFIAKESFAVLRGIENKKWDGKSNYSDWKKQVEKEREHAIKNLVPYLDWAAQSVIIRINVQPRSRESFLHSRLRLLLTRLGA